MKMPAAVITSSLRLFTLFGIPVFLHWTWLIVAVLELTWGSRFGLTLPWAAALYVTLFAMVLLHEFGHALACKSVGGTVDKILLWPLGGIAFVRPPPRPGPYLWSFVAGPLVNVVLLFPSVPLYFAFLENDSQLGEFVRAAVGLNALLLAFNLLPVYPLDGGQIVQSLLWFVVGRARSLQIAAGFGILGALAAGAVALYFHQPWFALLAAFGIVQSWSAVGRARILSARAKAPRRVEFACPACRANPPAGPHWICSRCRRPFDVFAHPNGCPWCNEPSHMVPCVDCGRRTPTAAWSPVAAPVPLNQDTV